MDTQSVEYYSVVAKKENLRIRIPEDLQEPFDAVCEAKGVSKQRAIEGALRFLVAREDVMQSLILGQLQYDRDIIALALKRLSGEAPPADGLELIPLNQQSAPPASSNDEPSRRRGPKGKGGRAAGSNGKR